jgi:hypothetical protein
VLFGAVFGEVVFSLLIDCYRHQCKQQPQEQFDFAWLLLFNGGSISYRYPAVLGGRVWHTRGYFQLGSDYSAAPIPATTCGALAAVPFNQIHFRQSDLAVKFGLCATKLVPPLSSMITALDWTSTHHLFIQYFEQWHSRRPEALCSPLWYSSDDSSRLTWARQCGLGGIGSTRRVREVRIRAAASTACRSRANDGHSVSLHGSHCHFTVHPTDIPALCWYVSSVSPHAAEKYSTTMYGHQHASTSHQ